MTLRALMLALLLVACGGSGDTRDASVGDATSLDAAPFPAPPALGRQIDRMGRPGVATMLVGLRDGNLAKRDAYNAASDPAAWATTVIDASATPPTTIASELAANLALLDALDAGHPDITGAGCGNAPLYTAGATSSSYARLAALLADDQLYVDTARTVCDRYLAIELATILDVPSTSCGGRSPVHDVVDSTYSLLFGGLSAFTPAPARMPRIGDGVGPHADVRPGAFPFLGNPR